MYFNLVFKFLCLFVLFILFFYPLLCLQFFLQIFLQFLQSQQEVGIQYSIREWIAISREKKIFLEIFFSVKSIAMTKKRLEFSALFVLPRAFLKNTNQILSKKLVSKIFLFCMCCVFYFFLLVKSKYNFCDKNI